MKKLNGVTKLSFFFERSTLLLPRASNAEKYPNLSDEDITDHDLLLTCAEFYLVSRDVYIALSYQTICQFS